MSRIPAPDFSPARFAQAPEAVFVSAPDDGVLPEGFFSSTNLPTYLKVGGGWRMPRHPRMDGVVVKDAQGELWVREMRRVRKGELVAMGEAEDGSQGIYVHAAPFLGGSSEEFSFMTSAVSREKPIPYEVMARMLIDERSRGGFPVWVTGPALVHARAREDMTWFIQNGFVGALLAGNAVAVHDIETALYGTTLGMTSEGGSVRGGHAKHLRAINRIRAAGSIEAAVSSGLLTQGIMHACVTRKVPYVLCGSIRDDGPLPGVHSNALEAQDAMKRYTVQATSAVFIATALHAIAVGNMLPSFISEPDGGMRTLPAICVDASEFVVSKLKDRGTHQAFGVVTNAQDFMELLRLHVERLLPSPRPG